MKKFFVISRTDHASTEIKNKIDSELVSHGFEVNEVEPDLVIVIGGDGKVLYAIRQYLEKLENVKFVALNTGTLGFLTDYSVREVDRLITDICNDNFLLHETNMVEATLHYANNKEVFYGANEFRIENRFRTMDINVSIGEMPFEKVIGNGLCISTPFGSTAYNRSLGGAIIDWNLKALQITEVAGISHYKNRSLGSPLIVSEKQVITLRSNDFDHAYLGSDNLLIRRENIEKIIVKISDKKVKLLTKNGSSILSKIKDKYIEN